MNHKELKKIATAVTSPTELNDFVQCAKRFPINA